jgi:hypothetical protein
VKQAAIAGPRIVPPVGLSNIDACYSETVKSNGNSATPLKKWPDTLADRHVAGQQFAEIADLRCRSTI